MKKLKVFLKVVSYFLLFMVSLITILYIVMDYYFFNLKHLPEGELLIEEVSPTGIYTVRTYLNNGNATVASAVRGEVIAHEANERKRNIYWQYRIEESNVIWISDHIVSINGVELDVRKDEYDYRE